MLLSLPSIKCSAAPPSFRLYCLNCAQRLLGSSRKLGGATEHLIDGSEKRICRLSFGFQSPHVIERRSNITELNQFEPMNWVDNLKYIKILRKEVTAQVQMPQHERSGVTVNISEQRRDTRTP